MRVEGLKQVSRRYFFMSMINAAMSLASLPLIGKLGMVACGISKNEAIISELMFALFAIAANEGRPLVLPEAGPMAWHSEH